MEMKRFLLDGDETDFSYDPFEIKQVFSDSLRDGTSGNDDFTSDLK